MQVHSQTCVCVWPALFSRPQIEHKTNYVRLVAQRLVTPDVKTTHVLHKAGLNPTACLSSRPSVFRIGCTYVILTEPPPSTHTLRTHSTHTLRIMDRRQLRRRRFACHPPLSVNMRAAVKVLRCSSLLLAVCWRLQEVAACDSLAVLPSATVPGLGGLYAKNADRHYTEAQPVAVQPRLAHSADEVITLDSGLKIPQVGLTYAHAGARPVRKSPYQESARGH